MSTDNIRATSGLRLTSLKVATMLVIIVVKDTFLCLFESCLPLYAAVLMFGALENSLNNHRARRRFPVRIILTESVCEFRKSRFTIDAQCCASHLRTEYGPALPASWDGWTDFAYAG